MKNKQVFKFAGEEIDVFWDRRLCIHITECGKAKGELFVAGRDPWCAPDGIAPVEVAEVCERCPTGALTYEDKSGRRECAPDENTINVAYNGPLYVSGDLEIDGAPDDMTGIRTRAALCRCGQSKNKPFCDNTHLKADFRDTGAIGDNGAQDLVNGGKLTIRPKKDGPLFVEGSLSITTGSGRLAWRGEKAVLCRCGESKNKPFCDGSHKLAGFSSD